MSHPTILIVCMKYSPVHNSLCRALGEPLRPLGFKIKYLLPQSLDWTVPQAQFEGTTFVGSSRNGKEVLWDTFAMITRRRRQLRRLLEEIHPSLLLFEASHPANRIVASLARSTVPGIKIWMLLHEPYVHEKSKHGGVRRFLISAHEWGVRQLLPYLDGLLVPSAEAMRRMEKAYPGFHGNVLKIPLLFEDRSITDNSTRHYFSFIGHAVPAKGIDTFFELVRTSAELGRHWSFQIATSSNISGYFSALPDATRTRLKVISKPRLRDEEIDQAIRESWAVLAPYRRVTQSGVVPVAFMHGTPVISTRAGGMLEFVVEGETGHLVNLDAEFSEWEDKFCQVQFNFSQLSTNCRRFFLDYFDANRGPEFLRPVLDPINAK